ncbi:Pyridoxamine 5'-phosphate oxidase-related protein [Desulfovibrio sp. X2]|uniref:pyridoxamine 5'-phosphate oxidase family protein n=1 Tax=Desulfovibrio sp. X2 TaxID=941449 RepID=UPI000358A653|nr:pyridoxamine 5'-phosphate oxidase family protein [Desulfovibrio sp. X2]EPR39820.1 Pyridoxamine 5'-phosphate oxidase-related protein [Desulfovibrio sp. X2]
MRKAHREIKDKQAVVELLHEGQVLHLALNDAGSGAPYVVPLSYAYADGRFYVHCATEGTKLDLMRADPRVGFSVVARYTLVNGPKACNATAHFASVCGTGTARILTDDAERRRGLDALAERLAPAAERDYPDEVLARTCVVEIVPERLIAKRNPSPKD